MGNTKLKDYDSIIWYDGKGLLSYNRMLNFIVGQRGGGKSFYWKKFVINKALQSNEKFMYVRRWEDEHSKIHKFHKDLQDAGFFTDIDFEYDRQKGGMGDILANGVVIGSWCALSQSDRTKSASWSGYYWMIFDEFIPMKKRIQYINQDEPILLLELIESIFRHRDGKVICIANSLSITNLYFEYFNVRPVRKSRYTKPKNNEEILIESYASKEFSAFKEKTAYGRLTKGTSYHEYAINNQYLNDNYNFVEKKTGRCYYIMTLKYNGRTYGLWSNNDKGLYYVSNSVDKSCQYAFSFTTDDHSLNTLMVKNARTNPNIKRLIEMFDCGRCRFETLSCKQNMLEVFGYIKMN